MRLPAGLEHRPLTMEDAVAVFTMMAADELSTLGTVRIEEADIVGDWQRPSFDPATSTVGVFDGDQLLGYAEIGVPGRGDATVHPEHRGRGIGTALALWMQERARDRGDQRIGMSVPVGSPGEALLSDLGYQRRWTSWSLVLPAGREVVAPQLPTGHRIVVATGDEVTAAWRVLEDAFAEWVERPPDSFEDWSAGVLERPGFEPWNLRVVLDEQDVVVGAVHLIIGEGIGYVPSLAVRRDQRGRGLARALLADAFGAAREHGATSSELDTDSRTGALDLYLGLGMEIRDTWVNLAIDLL